MAGGIEVTSDGGYIIAGWTTSFGSGNQDLYVIKLAPEVKIEESLQNNKEISFNNINTITIANYLISRKTFSRGTFYSVTGRKRNITSNLRTGVYFVFFNLDSKENGILKKMIILKR